MNTKLLVIAGMALANVGLLVVPSGAQADEIVLGGNGPGPGATQSVTFQGVGGTTVSVSLTAGTNFGYFDSLTPGSITLGADTFSTGPKSSEDYQVLTANSESFSYVDPLGDKLAGNIDWTMIEDDTPAPKFYGTLSITSFTGVNPGFISSFSGLTSINLGDTPWATANISYPTLDALVAANGNSNVQWSSGAVQGVPGPTVGAGLPGLILAGGFLFAWRRSRRTNRYVSALAAA